MTASGALGVVDGGVVDGGVADGGVVDVGVVDGKTETDGAASVNGSVVADGQAVEPNVSAGTPSIAATVTRERDGVVRYDLRFDRPAGADRAWLVVRGSARVVDTDGFERVATGNVTRLRWTDGASARAALVVPVNASGDASETATSRDWTFARVPYVEFQWRDGERVHRVRPLAERRDVLPAESGAFGDRYAVVGEYETVTRSTPGGRIDLIVPAGAISEGKAGRVADALARAARDLDVGDADERVLAFAAPGSVRWGGESVPARDEFWVNSRARLDSAEAVWLHEYVHTRQSFVLDPEMAWFREASAEYYAARLSREQGRIDRAAMAGHLDGAPSDATLTDPQSWTSPNVPQRKGGRALAVLDRRIRDRTYGHRSLEDVFRRLNRHDGVVTYAVFEQAVAEVTGERDDAWLDRHVNGSAPVADQYGPDARPLAAGLLASLGGGDTAASPTATAGLLSAVRGEGVAFFSVATGFSVVAALPLYGLLQWVQRREPDLGGLVDGAETP
ncbi:hypothetical protein [Halosimplex salinum]|uniref:hypothetical protein n=1 Tax=Halosimplex salinum TaxID=1710538 RepID=UPI000F4619FC|nr:hypothetical protein [Halosimplex salinum]